MKKADIYIKLTERNIKYTKKMKKKDLLNLLHTTTEEIVVEIERNSNKIIEEIIMETEPFEELKCEDTEEDEVLVIKKRYEKTPDHDFKIEYLTNRVIHLRGDLKIAYQKELDRLLSIGI